MINPARMASANGPVPNGELALDALEETAEWAVSLVAVYGATSFDLYHVGDPVRESFGSRDELVAHLSDLAEETRREFMQRGLFSGLSPVPDRVEYQRDERADYDVLQVNCGGRGMLLFVEPEEPTGPLVRTVSKLLVG